MQEIGVRTAKTRVDIPICFFLYSFIALLSSFVWFKFEALKDTPKKINLCFQKKSFGFSEEAGVGLRWWQQLWVLPPCLELLSPPPPWPARGIPMARAVSPGVASLVPSAPAQADTAPSLPAPTLLLPWATTKLFFCPENLLLFLYFFLFPLKGNKEINRCQLPLLP